MKIVRVVLAATVAFGGGACGGEDNPAQPSPEAVLDMTCAELQQAWQSHRRGEWDAPGTFNLLTDEINEEC